MTNLEDNTNLQDHYVEDAMTSFWDRIRFWFLIRKLRRDKQLILWESNMDKLFYETQYRNYLTFDDAKARAELVQLHQKEADKVTDDDKKRIEELEVEISTAKAIKQNYRKNQEFRREALNYISMIDQWKNDN